MVLGTHQTITSDIEEAVRRRTQKVLTNILKIRTNSKMEKLLLVADSLADLRVFEILSEESIKANITTELIYYITNFHDNPAETNPYLNRIKNLGVSVIQQDILRPDKNILQMATRIFSDAQGSVAISNLSDDYDIRQSINDYASSACIPILEVPTIDMLAFTSNVFSEDLGKMQMLGNAINEQLRKYEHLIFISSDGTYLKLFVNPEWLNEGINNFSHRYWDFSGQEEIKNINRAVYFPQDNPPGEIYTNIRNAHGRLVLYQFDNEVEKYILRNKEHLPFEVDVSDSRLITFNLDEPVTMEIVNGLVDLTSIDITQNYRAKILKYFLEQKQKEDEYYITEFSKHLQAAAKTAELGFGINSQANNPDEEVIPGVYIDSTLITEKKLGVWHIAFGNTPCPDLNEYFNHSSSHIDCGLRNPDLFVFGHIGDRRVLLFSSEPEAPGIINQIISTPV